MSLLDKASLVVTPNGYSENTIYSVIPSSGAGDLTFTRATDAWRTNSQGLVQRFAWNLLQHSEQFDNGVWSKSNATIASNTSLAPNGTLTTDTLTRVSGTGYALQTINQVVGTPYTYSIWLRGSTNGNVIFGTGSGLVFSSIAITTSWQRYSFTITSSATSDSIAIFLTGATLQVVDLWGAQVNEGSSALEYFPTTDRQDVPRIDYSLGGCPTLLMEPQRTNLFTYSQSFSDASWIALNSTKVSTNNTDPSGLSTALNVTWTSGGSKYLYKNLIGLAIGTTYTVSFYVRSNNSSKFRIYSESLGLTSTDFTTTSNFQKFQFTYTATVISQTIGLQAASDNSAADLIVAFAQLEAGAYPTSYIPTTTASVTRNADSFSRNNIYTNGLISASGGTWFVDLKNNVAMPRVSGYPTIYLSNTTNGAAGLVMGFSSSPTSSRLSLYFWQSGVFTNIGVTSTDNLKVAFTWTPTTLKVFINGVLINTYTGLTWDITTIQNLTEISEVALFINEIALFRTPLSDSELELLTGDSFDSYAKMAAYFNYTLQ